MGKMKFLHPSDYLDPDVVYPCGSSEFPEFGYNEQGELVETGKKINCQALIESYKDTVLLSKIIERCSLTGETLEAPAEMYGDTRILPKSLLEAHENQQKVQSFVDSLSDADLTDLNKLGFDAFIQAKLDAAAAAKASEIAPKEGNNE